MYHRKTVDKRDYYVMLIALTLTFCVLMFFLLRAMALQVQANSVFVSPTPMSGFDRVMKHEVVKKVYAYESEAEEYIHKYANMYGKDVEYTKFQLYCLYWKESRNGRNNGHGDNGMAGGPMQFWEETYTRMRTRMIDLGITQELGDRYNLKTAIETTAWAINNGYALEWGPILRGECK